MVSIVPIKTIFLILDSASTSINWSVDLESISGLLFAANLLPDGAAHITKSNSKFLICSTLSELKNKNYKGVVIYLPYDMVKDGTFKNLFSKLNTLIKLDSSAE